MSRSKSRKQKNKLLRNKSNSIGFIKQHLFSLIAEVVVQSIKSNEYDARQLFEELVISSDMSQLLTVIAYSSSNNPPDTLIISTADLNGEKRKLNPTFISTTLDSLIRSNQMKEGNLPYCLREMVGNVELKKDDFMLIYFDNYANNSLKCYSTILNWNHFKEHYVTNSDHENLERQGK